MNCRIVRLPSRKSFAVIGNDICSDGWFLQEMQLEALLETENIDLVVDVGANEGQFAKNLRQFYKGDIVSFEPASKPFHTLSSLSSKDPRWSVYKYALGDQEGERIIHVSDFTVFSSLLKTNAYCTKTFGRESTGTHQESIQLRRLENCLRENIPNLQQRRLFVKLDTQGYDLHAFNGLGDALSQVKILQSEVSLKPLYDGMPHWTESISTYERAGFRVAGMFPVVHDAGAVVEYDCILIHRS